MSSRSRCTEATVLTVVLTAVLTAVVSGLLGGCALSAQSEPERVAVSTPGVSGRGARQPAVPLSMQVYLVHGNRLERVTRLVSPGRGLEPVLRALSAPVDSVELAAGLRTDLPTTSRPLTGTMTDPRTAVVTVPAGYDRLSMVEQEMAVAQIVFTVAADTLADRVRITGASGPVAVPVPRGDLVSRPVTRQDYAPVAPTR